MSLILYYDESYSVYVRKGDACRLCTFKRGSYRNIDGEVCAVQKDYSARQDVLFALARRRAQRFEVWKPLVPPALGLASREKP